jgi:hypothetical protein
MDRDDAFDVAIARRLAGGEFDEELVSAFVASQEPVAEYVRALDVCAHGICIDYAVGIGDFGRFFEGLFSSKPVIVKIDGFPWGIIDPREFRFTVANDVRAGRG